MSSEESELGTIIGSRKILRFALPSIVMMVFISSYSIVDGLFVSNWIGSDALAALNLTMPAFNIFGAIGFMFATGGSAYVATLLGKKKEAEANSAFTQIMFVSFLLALLITALGFFFADEFVSALGADSTLAPLTLEYWNTLILFVPFIMMQFIALQFLIVIGRPQSALAASVMECSLNIFLDWVFIDIFGWGLAGAAFASGLGTMCAIVLAFSILCSKKSHLKFVRCKVSSKVIVPTCTNGVSEMATNLAAAVTSFLFNIMMMKYAGPNGVSAISIILYVEFLAVAVTLGYSSGVAPVMSYHNGAGDDVHKRELFRFSMKFVCIFALAVFIVMEIFAGTIVGFFVSGSSDVGQMATEGARIHALAFLLMGVNDYASALFTSLSNGLVSAVISGVSSFIILAPIIVALPILFGIHAIWFAVPLTELISVFVTIQYFLRLGPKYGFLKRKNPTVPDV